MALVGYSDSESDAETPTQGSVAKLQPSFQKSEPGKIKIDLPALRDEPGDLPEGPIAKRARTGGAFSGFNSFLPAPKRATQNAPKKVVNLKTSSEAAFSRGPPPPSEEDDESLEYNADEEETTVPKAEDFKLRGKTTMFVPPSVAKRRKDVKAASKPAPARSTAQDSAATAVATESKTSTSETKSKLKQSLFSFQPEKDDSAIEDIGSEGYEPLISAPTITSSMSRDATIDQSSQPACSTPPLYPGSLSAVASDLNLTSAQRRQLFGRNSKNAGSVSVANFNIDNEYASNEALRQAGEVVQHRAVKTIAPGKHSLQQLVNNARNQKDAIEDAWAEGRRNRGEGGSKYGWSNG